MRPAATAAVRIWGWFGVLIPCSPRRGGPLVGEGTLALALGSQAKILGARLFGVWSSSPTSTSSRWGGSCAQRLVPVSWRSSLRFVSGYHDLKKKEKKKRRGHFTSPPGSWRSAGWPYVPLADGPAGAWRSGKPGSARLGSGRLQRATAPSAVQQLPLAGVPGDDPSESRSQRWAAVLLALLQAAIQGFVAYGSLSSGRGGAAAILCFCPCGRERRPAWPVSMPVMASTFGAAGVELSCSCTPRSASVPWVL